MKKIWIDIIQILVIWACLTLPSSAETLSSNIFRDQKNTVHFGAAISEESYKYLRNMYNIRPFSDLNLTSNGGDFDAGMKIAQLVYQENISVYVPKYCASACTFIFFGAKSDNRDIAPSALLGLHNVSFSISNSIDTKTTTITVDEAMDFAQKAVVRSAMMISFYSANGIPSDVLLQVSQTYGNNIVNIQRSDLVRWGSIQDKRLY